MKNSVGNLTHRSVLNTLAAFLAYFVRIGVGFIVNPMLLGFLGSSTFGIWQICQRLLTYVESAEGRGTQALKWILANSQQSGEDDQRRRAVGSAIAIWVFFIPLVLVVGVLVVWFGPRFISGLDPDFIPIVRLACAILVLRLLVLGVSQIPEAVLQGMNAGYRMTWAKSFTEIFSGIFLVSAAWFGFGLVGLAVALSSVVVLLGVWLHFVARRYIKWYGVDRPSSKDIRKFFRFGIWVFAWTFVNKFLLFSDVVILGFVLNPEAVTGYTLTLYPSQMGVHFSAMLVSSAIPGFGGLLGNKEYDRTRKARSELLVLLWLFMTVLGSGILIWNRSFIGLWVGEENFCGQSVNLVLVLMVIQQVFFRADAFLIDATLDIKKKVILGACAAIIGIIAAIGFGRQFGVLGVIVGQIGGRLLLSVAYPLIVTKAIGGSTGSILRSIGRPFLFMLFVLFVSWRGGQVWTVYTWFELALASVVTVVLVSGGSYLLGLSNNQKVAVRERALTALSGRK